MDWSKYPFYFIAGGIVTTAIVALEESGMPLLSRFAALFPVFTWLAYLFIGSSGTAEQVASHATFVLIGTIVSWIPYMLCIIYFAPKFGVVKAVLIGIAVFVVIALTFSYFYLKLHHF